MQYKLKEMEEEMEALGEQERSIRTVFSSPEWVQAEAGVLGVDKEALVASVQRGFAIADKKSGKEVDEEEEDEKAVFEALQGGEEDAKEEKAGKRKYVPEERVI